MAIRLNGRVRGAPASVKSRPRPAAMMHAHSIWLFGSRARGEGNDESDLDVVVVIDGLTSAEGRSVAYLAGDALTHHDVLLSPFVVSTVHMTHLRERERLIAREIARDALPL